MKKKKIVQLIDGDGSIVDHTYVNIKLERQSDHFRERNQPKKAKK